MEISKSKKISFKKISQSSVFALTASVMVIIIFIELIYVLIPSIFYEKSIIIFTLSYISGLILILMDGKITSNKFNHRRYVFFGFIFSLLSVSIYIIFSYIFFACIINYWISNGETLCSNPIEHIKLLRGIDRGGLISYEENGVLLIESGKLTKIGEKLNFIFHIKILLIPFLIGYLFAFIKNNVSSEDSQNFAN